jgi:ABC-2 type transport system ATP-binding protein
VQTALEKCNLVERRKTIIRKLSKGFRQRVGIAQAIVHDPPVIILDEPTVGLDPRQIIDVRNLIKQLANDHTVILSTHILPEVSMTCDRIAIINRGKIVATNTPAQLMAQLTGGSGYELEVEGNWALVQVCLSRVPGVHKVEQILLDQYPEDRYRVRVMTDSDQTPGQELAAALVGNGITLHEMKRVQASLEDVFINLTTEEKPAEEIAEEEKPE